MKSKRQSPRPTLSNTRLDELIEEATVDAYGDSEQTTGLYSLLEEHLHLPFHTEVLGIEVAVEALDMTEDEQIVAVYSHGKSRQRISLLDLPLPSPPPGGAEWIDAYRRWACGR